MLHAIVLALLLTSSMGRRARFDYSYAASGHGVLVRRLLGSRPRKATNNDAAESETRLSDANNSAPCLQQRESFESAFLSLSSHNHLLASALPTLNGSRLWTWNARPRFTSSISFHHLVLSLLVDSMFNLTRPFQALPAGPPRDFNLWASLSWSTPLHLIRKLVGLVTSLIYAHLLAAYGKYIVAAVVGLFLFLIVMLNVRSGRLIFMLVPTLDLIHRSEPADRTPYITRTT